MSSIIFEVSSMFVLHVTKFLSLRENYVMFITQRLPVVVQTLASSIVT